MDPQATWDELVEKWQHCEWQDVSLLAESLLEWLGKNGFPPETMRVLCMGTEWNRAVALAVCQIAIARATSVLESPNGMEQYLLREFTEVQRDFDIVLIDCPPNLYRCSWTSMIASDWVVIPVPPEDFGTQGLRAVQQAIEQASQLNQNLRTLGQLVTRRDRRLMVHRAYEQQLRNLYGEIVLETVIPEASAFKVALARRMPVEFSSPNSAAANLTRTLAREILDRVALKNGSRRVA